MWQLMSKHAVRRFKKCPLGGIFGCLMASLLSAPGKSVSVVV